jgi:aspartate-semialdehyde dehydrogenase
LAKAVKADKGGPRVALVGGETLLGRELNDVLKTRLPGVRIDTFAATGEGTLGESEGEAVFVEALTREALAGKDAVVIAGTAEGANKAYDVARAARSKAILIDCTGYLEDKPEARIVAPMAGLADASAGELLLPAHPAAAAIGITLLRLAKLGELRRSVIQIFAPASEHGKLGIAELHQQTTSLLAFKSLDKNVFDAQLSFNLLSKYGEDAPRQLAPIEQRIERELASILDAQAGKPDIAMPSLRLLQAPVFHGYTISFWVEFADAVTQTAIEEALASAQVDVREAEHEPPTNVGAAGQSGVIAGDIRLDRNNPRAAWLWVVGDNVRLLADACADILGQPRTTIQ